MDRIARCDYFRHGRACPGHPRLPCFAAIKTWMPGTRPGMTNKTATAFFIGGLFITL
jgi:hypothetical protein